MLEHEGSLVNDDIEVGLLVCVCILLVLFVVLPFIAGPGSVVGTTTVAAWVLGLAVTEGVSRSLRPSFWGAAFPFAFGSGAGGTRGVAVLLSLSASSSSFSHLFSLTFIVSALSFVGVRGVE